MSLLNVHEVGLVAGWLASVLRRHPFSFGSKQGTKEPQRIQSSISVSPRQKQPPHRKQENEGQEKLCLFASLLMYILYMQICFQTIHSVVLIPPPFCSIKRTNISFFSLILHFVFLKPGFLLPLISQVWEKIKSNPEEIKR